MTLTVTLGVPGSGKSTWAATQPGWWACTDNARLGHVRHDEFIEALQMRALRQLRAGVDVVTDGCNVDIRLRRSWLSLGRDADVRCVLAIVECDPDEAMRRNAARPRGERVRHDRMVRYLERLPGARAAVAAEGWDDIIYPMPRSVVVGASRSW